MTVTTQAGALDDTFIARNSDNFERTPQPARVLDQATNSLPSDHQAEGLLDVNDTDGRDHRNGSFMCFLAGAGTSLLSGRICGRCHTLNVFHIEKNE